MDRHWAGLMFSLTLPHRTKLLPAVFHHTGHTVVSSCSPPQQGCAVSFETWLPSTCLCACNFDLDTYKGPFLSDDLGQGTRSSRCWCGGTLGGADVGKTRTFQETESEIQERTGSLAALGRDPADTGWFPCKSSPRINSCPARLEFYIRTGPAGHTRVKGTT